MGMLTKDWTNVDRKEKRIILLCISNSILLNVLGEYQTTTLWENLGAFYQSNSMVNKCFLWNNLYLLRMNDGDLVTKHLNALNILVIQFFM
jgi:hypothetical protein